MGRDPNTELADLRTLADTLRGQYDASCSAAASLHADWRKVTDHSAGLWKRYQAILATIADRRTTLAEQAKRHTLAAMRKTG